MLKVRLSEQDRSSIFTCTEINLFKLKLRLLLAFYFISNRAIYHVNHIFVIFANFGFVYTWFVLVSVFALKMLKVRLWEQDRNSIFTCTEIHFFKLKLRLFFSLLLFIRMRYLWCHQIFVIFANFGYVNSWIVLVSVFALNILKVGLWEQDRSSIFTWPAIHCFKFDIETIV